MQVFNGLTLSLHGTASERAATLLALKQHPEVRTSLSIACVCIISNNYRPLVYLP